MPAFDGQQVVNVLSLDGGGIRGLSSLLLLRDLMQRAAIKKGLQDATSLRPSQCFDLIIGTGTGGISALFLGRMLMTVDEAISEYGRMAKAAFTPTSSGFSRRFRTATEIFDGQALQEAISEIAERFLGEPHARLEDTSKLSGCRTAALAATNANAGAPPHVFRSYTTSQPASSLSVAEVARATAATAGLFPPVSLGNPPVQFIDAGAAGYNNPAEIALQEASQIWPSATRTCLISLGTGMQKIISPGDRWQEISNASNAILQSCEHVHDRVVGKRQDESWSYFRFNVDRGLDAVGVTEWSEVGDLDRLRLTGVTEAYLQWQEVRQRLDACVRVLSGEVLAGAMNETIDQGGGQSMPLLNPAPQIFHGRGAQVKAIVDTVLHGKAAYIAILGPGGIGKTSIARSILHDQNVEAKFGSHRRFISCESITTTSLLVNTLCMAFQLQNLAADRRKELMIFFTRAYTERPLLLILDNFETLWDAELKQSEELLQTLGAVDMLSLLVTMRGSVHPAGLRWTSQIVEPLSPGAACATFLDISSPKTSQDGMVAKLLDAIDHVPLAVTLMANLAQTESAERLLERWNKDRTQLLNRGDQDKLNSVDVSVRLSLESRHMKRVPSALVLLGVISTLPLGIFQDDLPQLCSNIADYDLALETLVQTALVYYDAKGAIRALSPIRLYIMHHHPPTDDLLHEIQSFHFQLASYGQRKPGDPEYERAVRILTRAEANIESVLTDALSTAANQDRRAIRRIIRAALDWANFLLWTRPRTSIIQIATQLSRHHAAARPKLADCLYCLGEMQRLLGEHRMAVDTLTEARVEFRADGDDHGAAWCLWNLGEIQRMDGDHLGARRAFASARGEFQVLRDGKKVTMCLWNLGEIQRALDDHEGARKTLSTARAEFEAAGEKREALKCQWSLGEIQRMLNNYDDASIIFQKTRIDFEGLGDRIWAAWCLHRLGDIERKRHHYDRAQEILTTSQSDFQSMGNRRGAVECLGSLGDIQRLLGRYDSARAYLLEAREEHLLLSNPNGAAWSLRCLGDIYRLLGECQAALGTITEARGEFKAVNDQRGIARCLLSLGDVHRMLHDYDNARTVLKEAFAMSDAVRDRYKAAECLLLLGLVSRDDRKPGDAKKFFEQARHQFQALGSWTKLEQESCGEANAAQLTQ